MGPENISDYAEKNALVLVNLTWKFVPIIRITRILITQGLLYCTMKLDDQCMTLRTTLEWIHHKLKVLNQCSLGFVGGNVESTQECRLSKLGSMEKFRGNRGLTRRTYYSICSGAMIVGVTAKLEKSLFHTRTTIDVSNTDVLPRNVFLSNNRIVGFWAKQLIFEQYIFCYWHKNTFVEDILDSQVWMLRSYVVSIIS